MHRPSNAAYFHRGLLTHGLGRAVVQARHERRDAVAQDPVDLQGVAARRRLAQLLDGSLQRRGVQRVVRLADAEDVRAAGRFDQAVRLPQLLGQLLARAQAGVDHRHVRRREPGQPDQVARQIDDAHRFAHVEDEQLAAA